MIVKTGHYVFNRIELKRLQGPIVYLFIHKSIPIYIGCSGFGISRPFILRHQAMRARKQADSLRIIFCPSRRRAFRLERYLIVKYRPPFNAVRDRAGKIQVSQAGKLKRIAHFDFPGGSRAPGKTYLIDLDNIPKGS